MLINSLKKIFALLFLLTITSFEAQALSFKSKTDVVQLTLIPEYKTLNHQTKEISVIAEIDIKKDWHIYWDNPGDTGDPTNLFYLESPYYKETETLHSAPEKSVFNDMITTYVHRKKLYFKSNFTLNHIDKLKHLPISVILTYTACQKECQPEKIKLNIALPIEAKQEINPTYVKKLFDAEKTFPLPLAVFARLSDKNAELEFTKNILKDCDEPEFVSQYPKKSILSDLPKTSIADSKHIQVTFDEGEITHDLKGILLCPGHAYYIDTNPTEIPLKQSSTKDQLSLWYYLLSALLAGLILNLMPCVLPVLSLKALYLAAHKNKASPVSAFIYLLGVLSSFLVLSGVLYYLRTAGTELGWGFQLQSPTFNIFLLLLFFLIFLNLIDKIIIPDKFADKLSKLAGNKSFLTGFFAVIIACPCTGPFMGAALGYAMNAPAPVYFGIFLCLGLGYALPYVLIESFPCYFLKFIPKPGHWMITLKRILSIPIALTCIWLSWIIYHQLQTSSQSREILWQTYNTQKVEQALENNESVLIDFTAKWCLICLLNDKTTLSSQKFKDLVTTKKIKLFKADWTNHNSDITEALKIHGRNSVPLYVYYPKGSRSPQYLPQILNQDILEKTIK